MGKFDHIAACELKAGKLVTFRFDVLPGQPELELEHLGEENAQYWNDLPTRAESKVMTVAQLWAQHRATVVKYSARHLRAQHTDGAKATDADIEEFVLALPKDLFKVLWMFVNNAEHWRESPIQIATPPAELAEKS